jgi:hypothetical protein
MPGTLRGVRRGTVLITGVLALVVVATAAAAWGGKDPARNFRIGRLPSACNSAPARVRCINAGVYYLDRARAKVGLPAYKLLAKFPRLTAAQQIFVLTNLDRVQYGLPPITGLAGQLNRDALVNGVKAAGDPSPSSSAFLTTWNANWAGGFFNAPMAYEAWMWDDGVGSGNADCTAANHAGCWGHRHNILWKFPGSAVLAMGAAEGNGPTGRAYATLIVGGLPAYAPRYTYTWAKAVAAGAGSNTYNPGRP